LEDNLYTGGALAVNRKHRFQTFKSYVNGVLGVSLASGYRLQARDSRFPRTVKIGSRAMVDIDEGAVYAAALYCDSISGGLKK
jgi:hypothetical protein